MAHPPANLYESLGYATNSLDTYRAKLLKIKWKLQEAERERQELESKYKHFVSDYLRFNSQHIISDRFQEPNHGTNPLLHRSCRTRYAYANMATVVELKDDPEKDTPRAGTAGINADPGDSAFDGFPSLGGDTDNAVPFVSTDQGSTSTITAVQPDVAPTIPTPVHDINTSFNPMNLSAERS